MSQLWDCTECGCRGISGGLVRCPMCQKETTVPKISATAGPTIFDPAAATPETEYKPVPLATPEEYAANVAAVQELAAEQADQPPADIAAEQAQEAS